jgi:outer membrane receptor protein involved in Fe transport
MLKLTQGMVWAQSVCVPSSLELAMKTKRPPSGGRIQKRDWNVKNIQKFSSLKAGVAPVVLGLAMLSSPAFAQSAAEETAGEIVVTGSRIARPNVESASPVTVVTSEAIKEFGATKIEDLTNSLPQVFAGQSSGVSNGADGTATIDLRGLGASRTVVLIDGRRLMPGNIGGGAGADLNFIPAALVSGVELLTGGASATYGADAVAGVVNFKMNRGFRGVRLDSQYAFYQHTNNNDIRSIVNASSNRAPEGNLVTGQSYDATLALGAGFDDDRGNVVAYAGYRHETAITQDKYDYSICTLNPNGAFTNYACGGSGTPARSRFGALLNPTAARTQALDAAGNLRFDAGGNPILTAAAQLASQTLLPTNALRNYSGATDSFNFGPANYFRRPSDRYTAGAFAEYEISDAFKPYMYIMFMDYSTKAQIAPSGAFYGPRTVNCDNPLLLANPNPKYRFNTNLKLTTANDFGFTVRWRYLGGVTVDTLSTDPDLASPGAAPTVDEKIKAQSYFDLLFALPIKDTMTLRIGFNNIFDRDPPLISQSSLGGFGNGNTFPGTYDYLGRNVFVNLSADF